jgi:hypothetical protein
MRFMQCLLMRPLDATSRLQGPNLHHFPPAHILKILDLCHLLLTLPFSHHELIKPASRTKLYLRDHIPRPAFRYLIRPQRLLTNSQLVQKYKLPFAGRLLPPNRTVVDVYALELCRGEGVGCVDGVGEGRGCGDLTPYSSPLERGRICG